MGRFIKGLAALLCLATSFGCATSGTDADVLLIKCANIDPLKSCTELIESQSVKGERLATALTNRGLAYQTQGKGDLALADYGEALRVKPDFSPALINRALYFRSIGNSIRAIADYSAAIEADPDVASAYLGRSSIYLVAGDLEHALADLDSAVRLRKDFSSAFEHRCLVKARMKQFEEALADCNSALAALPDADRFLTQADLAALREPGAAGMLEGRLTLFLKKPSVAQILEKRGYVYLLKKDYDSAIADFETALTVPPGVSPNIYHNQQGAFFSASVFVGATSLAGRGLAKIGNGDLEGGRTDIQQATTQAPGVAAMLGAQWGVDLAKVLDLPRQSAI